jgi:hypothetical protein
VLARPHRLDDADGIYVGRKKGWKPQRGGGHKMKVLSLVERGGSVRSMRMNAITVEDVTPIVLENVARESRLMTDKSRVYLPAGRELAGHEAVNHSAVYGRVWTVPALQGFSWRTTA